MKFTTVLAGLLLLAITASAQSDANLLEKLMQQKPAQFGKILANPNDYRLQILYTQIDRDKNNISQNNQVSYSSIESQEIKTYSYLRSKN